MQWSIVCAYILAGRPKPEEKELFKTFMEVRPLTSHIVPVHNWVRQPPFRTGRCRPACRQPLAWSPDPGPRPFSMAMHSTLGRRIEISSSTVLLATSQDSNTSTLLHKKCRDRDGQHTSRPLPADRPRFCNVRRTTTHRRCRTRSTTTWRTTKRSVPPALPARAVTLRSV